MSADYEDQKATRRSPYAPPEETPEQVLARGRPFPPHEQMVIDELTDEEAEAFWMAINQA